MTLQHSADPEAWRRLHGEVEELRRENVVLRQRVVQADERERSTREWLHNQAWPPEARLIALAVLWQTGAAPGDPAPYRGAEWTQGSRAAIARALGLSEKTVHRHWPALREAGLVRERTQRLWSVGEVTPTTEWITVQEASPPKLRGVTVNWRSRTEYAPPEGAAWTTTWAQPGQIPFPGQTAAHAREANRQADERARLKRILAQCPHCGSTDVALVCHDCGAKTRAAELSPARRVLRRRRAMDKLTTSSTKQETQGREDAHGQVVLPSPLLVPTPAQPDAPDAPELSAGTRAADPTCTVEAAVEVIAPAVTAYPTHLRMTARRSERAAKYITKHWSLTPAAIAAHLRGECILGGGLFWSDDTQPSGRAARAIAWDADTDLRPLIRAANRLQAHGLKPLLVRNPSKAGSGHLWLFFMAPVDPAMALAAAEAIAPDLARIPERFPHPQKRDGARIRLPGGRYKPVGSAAVAVQVATAPGYDRVTWVDGTTPAGWAVIAAALSDPAILRATYVPRPQRPRAAPQPRVAGVRSLAGPRVEMSIFDRFNATHPIGAMVTLEERGGRLYFKAPWRPETQASVLVNADGSWHDFGGNKWHGQDAFDLWCAIEGYWDMTTGRPDRRAGLRAYTSTLYREEERRALPHRVAREETS